MKSPSGNIRTELAPSASARSCSFSRSEAASTAIHTLPSASTITDFATRCPLMCTAFANSWALTARWCQRWA